MHILLVKVALGMDKVVLQSLVKALVVLVALPCALCCSGPAAGGKLHRRWAEEQPFVVHILLVKVALGMDKVVLQSLVKAGLPAGGCWPWCCWLRCPALCAAVGRPPVASCTADGPRSSPSLCTFFW